MAAVKLLNNVLMPHNKANSAAAKNARLICGDRPDALRAPGLSSRSQVNFIGYQARADSRAAYQSAEADFLPQENAPHFPLVGICLAPRRYTVSGA